MLCTPTLSALVAQTAVRVFPEPVSAIAPQFAIVVPPSVKLTVPVGATPATAAVKDTVDPTVAMLLDELTVVVVDVGDEPLQFPDTPPLPSRRNVAVARHPATIRICWPPPKATGVIGCGGWNDAPLAELA